MGLLDRTYENTKKNKFLGPAGGAVVTLLDSHMANCRSSPRSDDLKVTLGTCARMLKTQEDNGGEGIVTWLSPVGISHFSHTVSVSLQ